VTLLTSSFTYCDRCYIPWSAFRSVCHVRALCSNGRCYWYDFFWIWQSLVSPRSCWILAYIGQPLPRQILPQRDPSPLIWASETFDCRLSRCLEIAQWSHGRAYRKPPLFFEGTITVPVWPPLPSTWGFLCIRVMSPFTIITLFYLFNSTRVFVLQERQLFRLIDWPVMGKSQIPIFLSNLKSSRKKI